VSEEQKKQVREQIGVILLAGVLVMSGLLLIKQPDAPATFTESANSYSASEVEKTTDISIQDTVKQDTKININKASLEELDTLPGVGPATAQKILDYRSQNGLFKTTEEINEVSGIGEVKYSQIKDLISI
jgi:comEA protein